jgi:hypothetical protein
MDVQWDEEKNRVGMSRAETVESLGNSLSVPYKLTFTGRLLSNISKMGRVHLKNTVLREMDHECQRYG